MSTEIRAANALAADVYNDKSSTMNERRLREDANTGATRRTITTPVSSPGKFIISGVTSPEDVSQSGRLTLERLRQVITNLRNDLDRANQLNRLYRQTLQSHSIEVPTMNDAQPGKESPSRQESGASASEREQASPRLPLALDTSVSLSRNPSNQIHTPVGQTLPNSILSDRSPSPSSPCIPSRSSQRPGPADLSDSLGCLSLSAPLLAPPSRAAPEFTGRLDDCVLKTNTREPAVSSESEALPASKFKSTERPELDIKMRISSLANKSKTDKEAGSSSQSEKADAGSSSEDASLSSMTANSSNFERAISLDELTLPSEGDPNKDGLSNDDIRQTIVTNPFPSPSERSSVNFSARLPASTRTQSPVSTHYSVDDKVITPDPQYQAVTSDYRIEPLENGGREFPAKNEVEISLDTIAPTDTGGNETQESSFSTYHDAHAIPADDNSGGPDLSVSAEGSFEEEFDLAVSQLKPYTTAPNSQDTAHPRSSEFAKSSESLSLASSIASSPVREVKAAPDAEELSQSSSPSRQQRPVTSPLLVEPDSLPLVTVHVSSTLEKLSHKSTYKASNTVILISVYDRESGKRLWRVRKSPNEFTEFNDKVRRFLSGHSLAKLPDKSLFASNSPSKVSKRNGMLEDYLTSVTSIPGLPAPAAYMLCQFLSLGLVNPLDDIPDDEEQEVRIRGFLTKKTKSFGTWKSRYFVLTNFVLSYYDSPGENAVGYLQIEGARIELPPQRHAHDDVHYHGGNTSLNFGNDYRHSFIVMERKKKSSRYIRHVFCAENEDDRNEWIRALREVDGVEFIDHNSQVDTSEPTSLADSASQGYSEVVSESSLSLISSMSSPRKNVMSMLREPNGATFGGNGGDNNQGHEPGATSNSFRASLITTSDMKNMNANLKKLRKRSIFSFRHRHSRSSDLSAITSESVVSGAPYGSVEFNGSKEKIPTTNLDNGIETFSLPRDDSFGGSMNIYGDELVFGRPISESMEYSSKDCDAGRLPAVVYRCIEYLDSKSAILTEGIFRMSGSSTAIRTLREMFDTQHDVNLLSVTEVNFDQHTVAGLLKLYLRSLPAPLIGSEALGDLMKSLEMSDSDVQETTVRRIMGSLPVENFTLLRFLMRYLLEIVQYSDTNKMTLRNIAIVFSPTLNVPVRIISLWLTKLYSIFDGPEAS